MIEPNFKTIIEPFRIKSVEPIQKTSLSDRKKLLEQAGLNVFLIESNDILIDLLTDSGTNAMSTEQWAAIMKGDESYAGSPSFKRFEASVKKLAGECHVIPTHQGRASERILFSSLCSPGQKVISNTLFDTTRANAENSGCEVIDIPCKESFHTREYSDFKGNIDLIKLREQLVTHKENVALVVMTVTNNSGGGQPASMKNLQETKKLCEEFNIPFMIDGCRFAENAYFIKIREKEQSHKSPTQICQEFFQLADVISISAKKDAIANIGGILCVREDSLAENCRNNLILTEGFPTYGGLAGRDLDAIAVGLHEALDPFYLEYRIQCSNYLTDKLRENGIPMLYPAGGHAVYLDAKEFLNHIPPEQYPGLAFTAALYEIAGIRTVEIGSVMFGKTDSQNKLIPHTHELVRFALPRRTYTQSHIDYVIEAMVELNKQKENIKGVKFTYAPKVLRHFTAKFEWIS